MVKIGDLVKNYQVTKEINVGGFCNSYFVTDGKCKYFMKEYYAEPKPNDEIFKPFYDNQCLLIERLNAMGTVTEKFVDHFVENDIYYQVKDPLFGTDLNEHLQVDGDYQNRRMLGVIVCGIVKNIHENGIVHQDLKPGQIMLVRDEIGKKTKLGYRIILSDFDWSIPDGKCVRIVGTPTYKSPEHYLNKTPLRESDIFTVGIMLYEFLTGRNPYDFGTEASDEEYGKRTLAGKINKEPKAWNPEIVDDINAIILKCLKPEPRQRPALEEIQNVLVARKAVGKATQITLVAGSSRFIIFQDREFGRNEMKQFFRDLVDDQGDPLYKYCDNDHPMLAFARDSSGAMTVSAPGPTKNYFLLNEEKVGPEKLTLKPGDKLSLFSTARSMSIGLLEIS